MEEYKSSSGYTKKEKIILTMAAAIILAATAAGSFLAYQKFKPGRQERKISIADIIEKSRGEGEKQVEEIQEVKVTAQQAEEEKTISPAEVAIKVYNGGAAAGSAGKMKEILTSNNYTKTEAGNAKGDYKGLVVYYEEKLEKEAQDLKEILKSKYATIEIKKGLPPAEGIASGILIVLGK